MNRILKYSLFESWVLSSLASTYLFIALLIALLSRAPCHNGMERPQIEDGGEGLQICEVSMNILNKQSQNADKG